ncbi:MAG: hypothetical protein IPG66_02305 [Hydrogenophilales bacterium]|nr:hypothetical protein [Hydrogenophilales bacterium]
MAGARHDIVIVVPVADRPRHLADCLASLAELKRRYSYTGTVSVLVVDDSLDAENLARHRAIAEACTGPGLACRYLSQDAQRALVDGLPEALRRQLAGVIGDGANTAHKGASITRNIAYLWLNRLPADGRKRLFWFLDSDQEFRVSIETPEGEDQPYAIDYFHWLDRIFSETPTRILTGKVVGDPPVSPAVMAGTFLDDVLAFLNEMAGLAPDSACTFHGATAQGTGDAAYHDMAELFGFKAAADPCRYRCPLAGAHDQAACFADFAGRLKRFFDGEHPTRRSFYQADDPVAGLTPARTIYTGNYVFTPEGLDWFIPFAALKLRMAGPTLGRIIRAEMGDAFVAANLPMLHKRTVAALGQSEFRPGIERASDRVDLSGEFERQYFGDVMLFTMERLTEQGYPDRQPTPDAVAGMVDGIETGMRQRYKNKQVQIVEKIDRLDTLFNEPGRWWNSDDCLAGARADFSRFIDNMRGNFAADAPGWRLIESARHGAARKAAIGEAILRYRDDRDAWRNALREDVR